MAGTKPRSSPQTKGGKRQAAPTDAGAGSDNRLFILAVAAIVVVGLAAVAWFATQTDDETTGTGTDGGEPTETVEQTAPVELSGDPLTPVERGVKISDPSTDPHIGEVAPTLTATGFDGSEVAIGPDGTAKAIYFLAHWCPHCQAEVTLVQQLISEGKVPDGLTIYGVSTAVSPGEDNHPPSDWFVAEGFEPTVVRDDEASSAFAHFGGSSFPYVVYLDADHRVVARSSGSLEAPAIEQIWQLTAG